MNIYTHTNTKTENIYNTEDLLGFIYHNILAQIN